VESELDAVAKFIFHRNDAMEDAYYSLIGSSRNAWYPHYHENKRTMLDGDFVLMDYAPTVGYYTSDVTRMWPVNGKFSAGQRELYGFYLAAYKAIIKSMRVGITAQAAQREAAAEMERLFAEWTFSKPEYRAGAKQFVDDYKQGATRPNAAMGHSVGLAVHDDGAIGGVLRPGMVFSIEPALRVPEEKIYIRLEDMFVVTEKGVEWMTDFVPMDLDAIEKLMKEEGVLQKYPRMAITTAQD
jgi:Xaa-Pro aminopeptidase